MLKWILICVLGIVVIPLVVLIFGAVCWFVVVIVAWITHQWLKFLIAVIGFLYDLFSDGDDD